MSDAEPADPVAAAIIISANASAAAGRASRSRWLDWSRAVAVGSLLGLVLLGLVWELWAAPLRPGGSWLVLKVLPLCLPLVGLLKNRLYTYRWVSLVLWLYVTEGLVRASTEAAPGNALAATEVLLCLLLFVACAVYVRLSLRKVATGIPAATPASRP